MDVSQYLDLFLEESMEHLQTLNTGLLNLESNPNRLNLINEIFRAAHTLKGMSATMGFEAITRLTHKMESLLGKIQEKKLSLNQEIINTLFHCIDLIENMLLQIREGETPDVDLNELLETITLLEEGQVVAKLKTEPKVKNKTAQPKNLAIEFNEYEKNVIEEAISKEFNVWKIIITLSPDCLMKGVRAFMVFRNLENIGEIIKSVPSVQDIEDERFDHEFILFFISKKEQKDIESVLNISEVNVKNMEKVKCKKSKEKLPEKNVKTNKQNTFIVGNKHKVHQTVRVDIGRLDNLMNLVGELVINKTRLEQIGLSHNMQSLNEVIEQINRITTDLQMVVQNVRMVSIEQVFNRFPRMVRDLSIELGKKVELIIEGKETELDRTVIDEIGDPLVHLIRNALDHGLETSEERKSAGKDVVGTLKLSAKHEGNRVLICVEDDGRGLDIKAIEKKALENNLVTATQLETMDEQSIINLIFEPGFSTVQVVTNVSGRGVGLDVVRSKINALSGQIYVETKKGQGSCFHIKLPLTLAIIQALLVKVQDEVFAIPLVNIDETTSLAIEEIKNIQGQLAMMLRGNVLPLINIKNILEVPGEREAKEYNVVIVQKNELKIGLIVEELIGQQEIVISSLGKLLSGLPGIVGASILGDGNVALILDIGTLF